MQIFDDFNEVYKKFTLVTYDPLNTEDDVSEPDKCCSLCVIRSFLH